MLKKPLWDGRVGAETVVIVDIWYSAGPTKEGAVADKLAAAQALSAIKDASRQVEGILVLWQSRTCP